MKLDILAIGAHPDDVELGCGATLAKEISKGKKILLALLISLILNCNEILGRMGMYGRAS